MTSSGSPNPNSTAHDGAPTAPGVLWMTVVLACSMTISGGCTSLAQKPSDRGSQLTSTKAYSGSQLRQEIPATRDEPAAVDTFVNSVGVTMVFIPSGTFTMGSPLSESGRYGDEAQHQVTLTRGYYIGRTEITQAQWTSVMGHNPSRTKGDDLAVDQVTWIECAEFCRKLSDKEGRKYRLPTEAEWEYACRAGTSTAFAFGRRITTAQANCSGKFASQNDIPTGEDRRCTISVGSFAPNAWGLFDMHGNVSEWCSDGYEALVEHDTNLRQFGLFSRIVGDEVDPHGSDDTTFRVVRGGSSFDWARDCRSAKRKPCRPSEYGVGTGLRLAMDPW